MTNKIPVTDRLKDNKITFPCKGCGIPVVWTSIYGDWCSDCKPRDFNKS